MTSPDKPRLFVDIETYSSVDIRESGAFKYAESDDFEILLIAYAWDQGPVKVIDVTDPYKDKDEYRRILDALVDPMVVKVAHNSAFERRCFHLFTGHYCPVEQWEDTMLMAAMNGLPMSLDDVGAALRPQNQKIKEGSSLIRYFCMPCKPTLTNGGRTRNLPSHAPDKWARFIEYCKRDVEVEQAIYYRLAGLPVPEWEKNVWYVDTEINERGVLVDTDFARSAIHVDSAIREKGFRELRRLTGLDNPNSVAQLKEWLDAAGVTVDSLDKTTVSDLKDSLTDPTLLRVLELRQMLGKTSTKKYQAMLNAAGHDNRVRGIMQYYGAGRTGRWAGRLVQPQNFPQNHLEDIDVVREWVNDKDVGLLEMCYPNVPDVLSQLIRTAIVAKPGHTLLIADYAAIEARVIAYLAGEQWRMDVFAQGGDIYCSSASQMFKVPVEKHGVNGHLRQKGKIAELACGYGGGVKALKAFGADKMGLTDEEMQQIVDQWREASPSIPRFWGNTEKAAVNALRNPGKSFTLPCGVRYYKDADALRCVLPSGRILSYWGAWLEDGKIRFMAQNQTTRKWETADTWGGKLVENIVQAFARDCLAVALLRLSDAGYNVVFHVHDEIIVEEPVGGRTWQNVAAVMGHPIDWAPGLLLRGDGFETPFYMKD